MNSDKKVEKKLLDIISFKSDREKFDFEVTALRFNSIEIVLRLMEERRMNNKSLANKLGVSESFISQLFSGDKILNYKILARLQRIFGVKFKLEIKERGTAEQKIQLILSLKTRNEKKRKGHFLQEMKPQTNMYNFTKA